MTKFARLIEKFETEDGTKCCIFYYWWEKAKNPLTNWMGTIFDNISEKKSYDNALSELSEKWYLPQCENNWILYFIKK